MSRREGRLRWTLGLLTMAAALPILAAGSTEPQRPNLQGTWKLNEDLTARMRESDRSQGGFEGFHGGMGRPGGRGGRRGGGFPGGPPGDGPEGGRRPGGPPPSMAALEELTIVQTSDSLTITDNEGHSRVLETDGSKQRDEQAPGGPVELRASWEKDGTLVVKIKPDQGRARTESYVVSNDGEHLYVTLALEGDGRRSSFKIRRAYDPVSGAA